MQQSTSSKRKSFKRIVIATATLFVGGGAVALMTGVTPAMAADLATQPDAQIAVFMIPLTILVLAVMVEAARIALRGNLPVEAPARRRAHSHWSAGHGEG